MHQNVIHVVYCLCIFKPTRCFKIDWASLIVRSKFTVFALFYFVFKGNFPSTSPRGCLYLEGQFNGGFLYYQFGGCIFGGAYFRNFTVCIRWSESQLELSSMGLQVAASLAKHFL